MKLEFGYLPVALDVVGSDWSISTLPNFVEVVSDISSHPDLRNRWIYPNHGGKVPFSPNAFRLFGMPRTHAIEHQSDDVGRLKFLLWVLSFFYGIRLSSEAAAFIDGASTEKGMLVDFVPLGGVEQKVLLAEAFWASNASNPKQSKRFSAAVHALFMAAGRQLLQFEQFVYLYAALDACFAMMWHAQKPSQGIPNHAERTAWMCRKVGTPVPVWASGPMKTGTEISDLRNDTLHEALFAGEPLGFALEAGSANRNLPLEMGNLVCRLLAAIIGVSDKEYVSMPTDIYARHALRL